MHDVVVVAGAHPEAVRDAVAGVPGLRRARSSTPDGAMGAVVAVRTRGVLDDPALDAVIDARGLSVRAGRHRRCADRSVAGAAGAGSCGSPSARGMDIR
ncbi:MAG: hypothetical protein U0P30_17170 [Vicinamibacterales bacterium]